jgi:exodeoxyribonuclease V alpha subunit
MIDNALLGHLLDGLNSDITLIFVGDHNQLPSVGPGDVLRDLIASSKIPVIELNDLYRQKENSYIITLAHEIKEGIISERLNSKQDDYNFIECHRNNISSYIVELCEKALAKGYSDKEIQVLIPMYKGINGIDNINVMLQNVFNPKKNNQEEFIYNNIKYRVGDKVLQIKNNNDLNISNGDIGTVKNIDYKDKEYVITIDFNDELYEYTPKDFEDIRLGYAISIHKSQGSEFDIVILPMDLSYNRMLYRKLIYTAVTRAKKSLLIVGEKEAFIKSIKNQKEIVRKTSLDDKLLELFNN